jgi:glycosyltransferase involved in cell wall biosynthesis
MISIIITARPGEKTQDFPPGIEKIVSSSDGFSRSRNDGAKLAHGGTLVFINADLTLKQGFLDALTVNPNQFKMWVEGSWPYPSSRVVVISRTDFMRLGGFRFSGVEDVDFYFRALDIGLKFTRFPNLVEHIDHMYSRRKRWRSVIQVLYVALHHVRKHPDYLKFELDKITRSIVRK